MGLELYCHNDNDYSYAWCRHPDDHTRFYDFHEHIDVALRVINRSLVAGGFLQSMQDVTQVRLTSPDVNQQFESGLRLLNTKWDGVSWGGRAGYLETTVEGYARSSVCLSVPHAHCQVMRPSCNTPSALTLR